MGKATINFIIPYFGSFPNYFQYFLNSCGANKDINWTIITDNQASYNYPINVNVVKTSFAQVKEQIQSCFEFDICLDNPHKLCEYKPAYGYIFSEFIQGYDFWGYCDVDVIYGRIREFITQEVLQNYNKILNLGHMTLIRNHSYFNTLFKQKISGRSLYKEAFTTASNYNFDEDFRNNLNINTLFLKSGEKIYRRDDRIADIYVKSNFFRLTREEWIEKYTKSFFIWDNGKLIRMLLSGTDVKKKEYMYIHLQKRNMRIALDLTPYTERFLLIPNAFETINCSYPTTKREFNKIKRWSPNLHYVKIRLKNLRKKLEIREF